MYTPCFIEYANVEKNLQQSFQQIEARGVNQSPPVVLCQSTPLPLCLSMCQYKLLVSLRLASHCRNLQGFFPE